jgi:hypothetical protein
MSAARRLRHERDVLFTLCLMVVLVFGRVMPALSLEQVSLQPFLDAIRAFTRASALPASSFITIALTGPTADGASESFRYPSAIRASALTGFDAISAHSATGLP